MLLAKDLIRTIKAKNEQLVNNINGGNTDLKNAIIEKQVIEIENPNKIKDIVAKILGFNIPQKR